jgi:hypothetical protein
MTDEEDMNPLNCLDCGVDTAVIRECYMIRDDVWRAAHPDDEGQLCVACLERRLGRKLDDRDFIWCSANVEAVFYGSKLLRNRLGADLIVRFLELRGVLHRRSSQDT